MDFAGKYKVVFLLSPKFLSVCEGKFKLNWSSHIVDRDNDFGGLLHHVFINFSFYMDKTQYYAYVRIRNVSIVY